MFHIKNYTKVTSLSDIDDYISSP